jgi:hypothetical protein
MRYLVMVGLLAVAPMAWADESSNLPDTLEQPSKASTGASRLGGPEINSPPHMQSGVGQSPELVTRDEIARQQAAEARRQAKRDAKKAQEAQPYQP